MQKCNVERCSGGGEGGERERERERVCANGVGDVGRLEESRCAHRAARVRPRPLARCSPHQLEWTDGDGGRRRGDRAARGAGEDDDDDDVCIFALGRRRRRAR